MSGYLTVNNISHSFNSKGNEKINVLNDINIQIHDGEFITIVGPSGCGKSTLFNILAGLIKPTNGNVQLGTEDVTGQTGHVGYMLQRDCLLPWRTVLDNLIIPMEINNHPKKESRETARSYLKRFGLEAFANEFPDKLSGGMRQRCAFIRTLLSNKDILLLDEPFGALDSQTKLIAQEWLLSVWDQFKKTIVFITHDIDEAIFLSDRVYIMGARPGRIIHELDVDLKRPRRPDIRLGNEYIEIKGKIDDLIRKETLSSLQYS